jgi:hypothetical protein
VSNIQRNRIQFARDCGWGRRSEQLFPSTAPKTRPNTKKKRIRAAHGQPFEQFLEYVRKHLDYVTAEEENRRLQNELAANALEIIDKIVELTTSVFKEEVRFDTKYDPEYPDIKYTVCIVETSLNAKAMLDAEELWINEMLRIAPECDIRLSVRPRE